MRGILPYCYVFYEAGTPPSLAEWSTRKYARTAEKSAFGRAPFPCWQPFQFEFPFLLELCSTADYLRPPGGRNVWGRGKVRAEEAAEKLERLFLSRERPWSAYRK